MLIDAVRDFLRQCPLLTENRINVDYLGSEPVEYTIETVPADPVVKHFVDGAALKQLVFLFASRRFYGPDILGQLDNSGFYEDFQAWVLRQSRIRNFPFLGGKRSVVDLRCDTPGYLLDATEKNARYQIQCKLFYYEEF